ncbi:MAG: serine hydrolase domain-containing protein [Patescibacteria group bacterium]
MKKDFTKAIHYTGKIADAWLPWKIQYDHIPGIAVGIVHKGKLVYQKGFGFADTESKIPMTPDTSFRVASISKTFTAVAIMQLVEYGKINLDDRIEQHLPWFKGRSKHSHAGSITIRHMLSHTGGVWRDGTTLHWENDEFPDFMTLKKSISGKSFIAENLARFRYSNFGFAVLGEIIAKTSGSTYGEYVVEHIIKKLGMEHTAPDWNDTNDTWLAKGYSRPIPNKGRETFSPMETKAYAPATGFLSNVSDLAKYLAALSMNSRGINTLLTEASQREMMKEYTSTREAGFSYGLGFDIYSIQKRKIVGHSGSFAGFITQISLDVENDIGVITLTNTNDSSCGFINDGLFESIYEIFDEENKYGEGMILQDQDKFEGAYRSRWDDVVVVGIDTKLIAFNPKVNSPTRKGMLLKPKGRNKFLIDVNSSFNTPPEFATFAFERGEKQATTFMSSAIPATRIEE